jgi:hypothetical protein
MNEKYQSPTELSAEQHARRFYKQNHFQNQAEAERAYFRVLGESLVRGTEIERLSRLLGRVRGRNKELHRANTELNRQLRQA